MKTSKVASVRIRLNDGTERIFHWTIRRVPRAINCHIGYNRVVSGWEFTDDEGYTRFAEGNWRDLVAMVHATAENYGLHLLSELSYPPRFGGKNKEATKMSKLGKEYIQTDSWMVNAPFSQRQKQEQEAVWFDYDKQAWVKDGKYVRCGHSETMNCGCYGRKHEGEQAS